MNSPALSLNQVIIVFFAFVALIVFISVIKKIHYRYILGKRYYIFPRVSAKGIANISMIISITVAIIILLTIVTAGTMGILFKAYPGARILIEGILINIGGLLFGPVIGLFIGGLTDLLTVLLTAGMFHYGYFVAAIAFGLFGGLVRTCLNISKHNNLKFLLLSSLMLIVAAVIICLNLYFDKTENNSFGGSMFGINVDISKNVIIYCFIGFFAFVLVFA
jgi:LytS/YehU family sensor histidine kinase